LQGAALPEHVEAFVSQEMADIRAGLAIPTDCAASI
jgi:hypothetical protein